MIHDISTTEFIAAVTDGSYNENDVQRYCNAQPSLMPLFKSLHDAALTLIASKGSEGGCMWNLTERRFDFDNPKDIRLYTDAEFVRMQSAMGIVCDLMQEQDKQIQKERAKPQHGKEKTIEQYITGNGKEKTIQAIKSLVCGKKGKQAAVYIVVAVIDGYMSKPTFDILKEAFAIVGTKQAFNNAYNLYTDTKCSNTRKSELDAARAALKRAIESAK